MHQNTSTRFDFNCKLTPQFDLILSRHILTKRGMDWVNHLSGWELMTASQCCADHINGHRRTNHTGLGRFWQPEEPRINKNLFANRKPWNWTYLLYFSAWLTRYDLRLFTDLIFSDLVWHVIYDIWWMIYDCDMWFMIYDKWFLIYDIWNMIYDTWYMIYGLRARFGEIYLKFTVVAVFSVFLQFSVPIFLEIVFLALVCAQGSEWPT